MLAESYATAPGASKALQGWLAIMMLVSLLFTSDPVLPLLALLQHFPVSLAQPSVHAVIWPRCLLDRPTFYHFPPLAHSALDPLALTYPQTAWSVPPQALCMCCFC